MSFHKTKDLVRQSVKYNNTKSKLIKLCQRVEGYYFFKYESMSPTQRKVMDGDIQFLQCIVNHPEDIHHLKHEQKERLNNIWKSYKLDKISRLVAEGEIDDPIVINQRLICKIEEQENELSVEDDHPPATGKVYRWVVSYRGVKEHSKWFNNLMDAKRDLRKQVYEIKRKANQKQIQS